MSDTQDPVPTGETNNPPEGGGGDSGHSSGPDPNALAAELRKAKKALKQYEQRISSFEKAEADRAEAELSEIEKYKAKAAEYESQLETQKQIFLETQKRNAFNLAAQSAGVVDAGDAWKLADLSDVEITENGDVSGIDSVMKSLKKTKPYLFGSAPQSAAKSGGNPSNGAPAVVDANRISKMSSSDFAALQDAVLRGEIRLK